MNFSTPRGTLDESSLRLSFRNAARPVGHIAHRDVMAWKKAASDAMDRYSQGDAAAFARLYDLLSPRLMLFLRRRVAHRAHAEDLLQHTFMKMHCARQHFIQGSDAAPWAFAIARRLLVDTHRHSGREILAEDVGGGEGAEGADRALCPFEPLDRIVAHRRLTRHVEEALARLPEPHRAAFELVYGNGLSLAETAEVLGTTVVGIKARMHKAHRALRGKLGAEARSELGVGR